MSYGDFFTDKTAAIRGTIIKTSSSMSDTTFLPLNSTIINKSLVESDITGYLKEKNAHVKPLIKKPHQDKDGLETYWPVSKLRFLSKFLEKVVATRLENHLSNHRLHDDLQSISNAKS